MTAKKKKIIVFAVVAAVLLALIIWTAWGNTALELNTYTISSDRLPEAFDGYRIAHVSDLHNAEMGKDNDKLLDMLREAEPDMCYRFENLTGLSIVCLKDRIPILICMCSVWAHQRLIECYASVIGCGLMILIGTNMHKSNEAWQRINGGMSSTMRMLKHQ